MENQNPTVLELPSPQEVTSYVEARRGPAPQKRGSQFTQNVMRAKAAKLGLLMALETSRQEGARLPKFQGVVVDASRHIVPADELVNSVSFLIKEGEVAQGGGVLQVWRLPDRTWGYTEWATFHDVVEYWKDKQKLIVADERARLFETWRNQLHVHDIKLVERPRQGKAWLPLLTDPGTPRLEVRALSVVIKKGVITAWGAGFLREAIFPNKYPEWLYLSAEEVEGPDIITEKPEEPAGEEA